VARNIGEIDVGPGTLYWAPVATTYPADPSVTPAGPWADIGYSDAGWVIKYDPKAVPITVEELMDPVNLVWTEREIHVQGLCAQDSIVNLQLAFGGGTITTNAGPPATQKLVPPALTDVPVHAALLFRAKGPIVTGVQKYRDWHFFEAMPVVAVEMTHKKAPQKTLVAQDWRALAPIAGGLPFELIELT
jgi:hypothetical protein